MIRPRTTHSTASPTGASAEPDPPLSANWRDIAPIVAALVAILGAMESGPKVGPAVKAYRSAIRRQGQEAAASGGSEAMEAVLRQVVEAAPDQAEREATITTAWAGLPGWRS